MKGDEEQCRSEAGLLERKRGGSTRGGLDA